MSQAEFTRLPVDLLVYSGRNPRTEIRGLEELAKNVEEYGVLEPIIVRPFAEKFEVVVGERRAKAATIAGLKEIPAIIRTLTDSQTDELRLIENVFREDLTDAEKGDSVYALLGRYPDKYKTIVSVSERLRIPYDTVLKWSRYSRRISDFVKNAVGSDRLGDDQVGYLLKYDHPTQNNLAQILIKYELTSTQSREFFRLYDANPKADLDDLAKEVSGLKKVRISLDELPEKSRKEVIRILEERKETRKDNISPEERKQKIQLGRRITEERKKKAKEGLTKRKHEMPFELFAGGAKSAELITKVEEKTPGFLEIKVREPTKITATGSETAAHKDVEQITREVAEIIRETVSQVPEKEERVSEIVKEELREFQRGLGNRLEIFPEKSRKMEPKFEKLKELEERGIILYTIWDFRYRDDYAGDVDFHGNCSPQVVEQCIWRFTNEGDLVVDPMAGSGTTLKVCEKFNRKCIAYDIKPPPDMPEIIQNDSQKIPLEDKSVDMVFIHPPYWNLTYFTKAEDNLHDLSRAKIIEEYFGMLTEVFKECYRILKNEKYMCVLLGDLVREGKFIPLCRKASNVAEEIGFVDCGYAVKLASGELSRKKTGVIFAELAYTENLKISHDFVMFFRKS